MRRVFALMIGMVSLVGQVAANPAVHGAQAQTIAAEFKQTCETDPKLAVIRDKIALFDVQLQTFAMFANTAKPTVDEKLAIEHYAEVRARYLERFSENDARHLPPLLAQISQRGRAATTLLLTDLHAGNLTYGEFAKRRQANFDADRREWLERGAAMQATNSERAADAARRDQQMWELGRALLEQGRAQPQQPLSGGSAMGIGFLKRSYVSGFNKICIYDRLGSDVAVTIGATELCPLNLR